MMDPLSPRSANVPPQSIRRAMKKTRIDAKPAEKNINVDKIEDKWRPASVISEPGQTPEVYHTGRKLGKGGFAVCFEGTLKRTGQVYALKVVKTFAEQKKQMEKFRTELQIHAKMRHPNIVEFHRAFAFGEHTYVVLELCSNGSLMDMVKSRSCLTLPETRRYLIQLCGGVKYMHQRAVIHRDLKMGNLFLDSKMNLKIGDFGLAAIVVSEKERRQTMCGTPNYIAPEILDKKSSGGHDHKVDTWAIGIIAYALLTGGPPFASKTQPEIYAKLKQLEYTWKTDGMNYIPPQAKDLVVACLNLTADARPEMDDLVEHDFFKMGCIAEEMSSKCRTDLPDWLEKADPRGDRVSSGYGVSFASLCVSCGVGREPTGLNRPAVGEHALKSAITEVEIENKQGLAPVVPLPAGVIYKQFADAKEDWTSTRKYPIVASKVRSRKTAPTTGTINVSSAANAGSENVPLTITNLPLRAPVQSFAAQQRQRALPTRMIGKGPIPPSTLRATEINGTEESSKEYLRSRPLRSVSNIPATGSSGQSTTSGRITDSKSGTISEGLSRAAKLRLKSSVDHISESLSQATTLTTETTTQRASHSQQPSGPTVSQESSAQDESIPARPEILLGSSKFHNLPLNKPSKHTSGAKPRLLDPSEHKSLLRSTRPREVLAVLQSFRENISSPSASLELLPPRQGQPHPCVEKWVDYTNKYGIAYILSDNTVGCVLRSSDDNLRYASCIVVRDSKFHYIQRSRESSATEVQQYLPSNGLPVEFYEHVYKEGHKKALLPADYFHLDIEKHGGKAMSELEKQMQTSYDHEKLRLVVLVDKFGKYMTKTLGKDEVDDMRSTRTSRRLKSAQKLLKFYQRLGNVGIWGFTSSSSSASSADSTAFQFNFPDHTKLILYDNGVMLDLYHLQPGDAMQLADHGFLSPRALERRRMLTFRNADVFNADASTLRSAEKDILTTNQAKEKLTWIRDVLDVWIREGGIGKMGTDEGKMCWDGLQESSKGKLNWVTVGREGGDGQQSV